MRNRTCRPWLLFATVFVVLAVLAAACGDDAEEPTTTTGAGETTSTTAGGQETTTTGAAEPLVFRSSWHEPTQPLDARQATSGSNEIASNLFEGLVEADAEGNISPLGATDWDVSVDGLVYTFHLNPAVKWSDGTVVTAGDYEYSIKTGLDPAMASPTAANLYAIAGAEAYNSGETTDPDTVGVRAIDDVTSSTPCIRPARPSS